MGSSVWAEVANRQTRPHKKTKLAEQRLQAGMKSEQDLLSKCFGITAVNRIGGARGVDQPPFDPFTSKRAQNKAAKQYLNRV